MIESPEFKCCSSSYVFWRFVGFMVDKEVGAVLRRVQGSLREIQYNKGTKTDTNLAWFKSRSCSGVELAMTDKLQRLQNVFRRLANVLLSCRLNNISGVSHYLYIALLFMLFSFSLPLNVTSRLKHFRHHGCHVQNKKHFCAFHFRVQ